MASWFFTGGFLSRWYRLYRISIAVGITLTSIGAFLMLQDPPPWRIAFMELLAICLFGCGLGLIAGAWIMSMRALWCWALNLEQK